MRKPYEEERYDRERAFPVDEMPTPTSASVSTPPESEETELQRLAREVSSFQVPELEEAQAADKRETGMGRASDALYSAFARRPMQQRGETNRNASAFVQQEGLAARNEARGRQAKQDAQTAALSDPNSEPSKRAREMFLGTKVGQDFANEMGMDFFSRLPASQIPGGLELIKLDEGRRNRQSEAERRKAEADAKAAAEAERRKWEEGRDARRDAAALERARVAAGARDSARNDKATSAAEKAARESFLEGYRLRPEVAVRPEDVTKLRGAQAVTRDIQTGVRRITELLQQHGARALPSREKAEMETLLADLNMKLKGPEVYALGVLAGPDMAILDSITGKPVGAQATALDMLGGNHTLTKLQTLAQRLNDGFDSKVRAFGYVPQRAAGMASGSFDLNDDKGSGLTPEEEARLEELEAKAAAGELQ